MKKIIIVIGILVGLSSFTAMQASNKGGKKGNRMHKKGKQECCSSEDAKSCCSSGDSTCHFPNLTDEQTKAIDKINEDFAKESKAIKMSRITEAMQDKKLKELKEKKKQDISNILTDEQKKEWKEQRGSTDKKRPMARGRGSNGASDRERPMIGGRGGTWVMAGIELSDKQKEEYKKVAESYQKERQSMQDKQRGEREKIDNKQQDAIKKILTDDQKKTFEENIKKTEDRREARQNK